jgi:uncharacterized protein (TIGR02996 family)
MSIEAGLLDDICTNPDEDAPRLICADWLEEHGQPERAEFIRVQIERAALPEEDARQPALMRRERRLHEQHARQWSAPLREQGFNWVTFRRGFVESVTTTAALFLEQGEELFRLAPVRGVEFFVDDPGNDAANMAGRLPCSPLLARLRRVGFPERGYGGRTWLEGRAVEAFIRCPHLAELKQLDLSGSRVPPESLQRLVAGPHWPQLELLDLSLTTTNAVVVRALAGSSGRSNLVDLSVYGANLDRGALQTLLASPHLTRLSRLDLGGNQVGDEEIPLLGEGARTAGLRVLRLGSPLVGPAGLAAFARSPALSGLVELGLNSTGTSDEGALALADSPHLGNLVELDMAQQTLTAEGFLALVRSPHLGALRRLTLSQTRLDDDALIALSRCPELARFQILDLRRIDSADRGALALAESPYVAGLETLWLSDNLTRKARPRVTARFGERLELVP